MQCQFPPGRLTREKRIDDPNGTPATLYDLTYAYDPLGNRKSKADAAAQTRVDYFYDTDPNATFGDYITQNNRLQSYRLYDTSGQGDELLRTSCSCLAKVFRATVVSKKRAGRLRSTQ